MAEFDEDINLEESESFLAGVGVPGKVIGSSAGLYGAAKAGRMAVSRGVIGYGGVRMNNIVKGAYKDGANMMKAVASNLYHSQYNDITELITKAADAGPEGNFHSRALDKINAQLPKAMKFGELNTYGVGRHQGSWWDYSKLNPKSWHLQQRIGYKPNLEKLHGTRSIGSLLAKANEFEEKTRPLNYGEFSKEATLNKVYRHEELKNSLVKQVSGRRLTPKDIQAYEANGLSVPKRTQANKVFTSNGPHAIGIDKWKLSEFDKLTTSQVIHRGDKIALTKSVKNSHMYEIQEYVTKELRGRRATKNLVAKYVDEFVHLRKKQGSFLKTLTAGQRFHRSDVLESAASYFKSNFKPKLMHGAQSIYINYSPGLKPNYLLGGVNANSGMRLNKAGKIIYDTLVTDMYDVTGSGLQKNQHLTYHYRSNGGPKYKFDITHEYDPVTKKGYKTTKHKISDSLKKKNIPQTIKHVKKAGTKLKARQIADKARIRSFAGKVGGEAYKAVKSVSSKDILKVAKSLAKGVITKGKKW